MRRRMRRGQRGSALILAILILFAMLGLGLIAMRSTTQNIAGAGNMRLNKQARYVAESGLYSVLGFFDADTGGEGTRLMRSWQAQVEGPATVIINDRGQARVVPVGPDGRESGPPVLETQTAVPTFLTSGPNPLGRYGETSGLQTSFEVSVEGFQLWSGGAAVMAGMGIGEGGNANRDFCFMQLTSRGYVAPAPVGADGFDDARDDPRFAEHTLKAGVVIEVVDGTPCQPLREG